MSSSSGASGPRAKCDQVIFEAMAKAAEIIVFARCPSLHYNNNNNGQHVAGPGMGSAMSNLTQQAATMSTATPTLSARFNLQVPEIAEIRQALQHHRHSLHLPLRLDVYANHVLVERWSLEYLQQQSQPLFGDPIVQLRQVCKKLVIWLRTLYCWTRMLPSFALRGPSLQYRLEVCEGPVHTPNFIHVTSKEVPTPYGLLLWRVWYAPNVQKPTTKPIPIQSAHTRSTPSPTSTFAKSAPNREYYISPNNHNHHQQHNNGANHHQRNRVGSFDRAGLLKKTYSNVEDHSDHAHEETRTHTRSHSSLSRRAALHDPPTYAYNNTSTPMQYAAPISHSPMLFSATPPTAPALLSSTPPTLGFLLPPPMRSNHTPPFSNLPRQLSKPEELCTLPTEQMPSSLDLLHSSPFRVNATAFSSLGDSEWMRHSSMPAAYEDEDANFNDCNHNSDHDADEDDMPFAVEMDEEDFPSALNGVGNSSNAGLMMMTTVTSTAAKQPLSILETELSQDLSALSLQLQEFKTFGARLDQ
ncbi:Autophagy-related protein 13 [Fragilaria crotonensis]|nr:Autophagy-related protein 13 [Fragilaria crotonensis]